MLRRIVGSNCGLSILLRIPPFILGGRTDERLKIIGDVPFMLSLVEAFIGFFSSIGLSVAAPLNNEGASYD
jgi:hypothetical protein